MCSIEGYGGSIYNVIPILGLGRSAEAEESIETDSEEMDKTAELTFQEEVNEHNMAESSAVTEEVALVEEVEIREPVEADTDQTIVYYWDEAENLENYRELIFRNKAVPKFILEFFFWLFFAALCHPCLWILVCCGGIYKVFAKRKFNALDVSCLIMVITGISIALYIYMGGKSNIYFALATYPVAWFFWHILYRKQGKCRSWESMVRWSLRYWPFCMEGIFFCITVVIIRLMTIGEQERISIAIPILKFWTVNMV